MRVLVACEFSGIVRDAFIARGHDAWSCDLLWSERSNETHIVGDVREVLECEWDLLIAHPPCTYLANSSNKHLYIDKKKENGRDEARWKLMRQAAVFFNNLRRTDIQRICLENPIQHCHARTLIPKYQQIVQPWMFGHAETKATCLWLKGLPELQPTNIIPPDFEKYPKVGYAPRVHHESPSPKSDPGRRMRNRSRTMQGLANAMAVQWGGL